MYAGDNHSAAESSDKKRWSASVNFLSNWNTRKFNASIFAQRLFPPQNMVVMLGEAVGFIADGLADA